MRITRETNGRDTPIWAATSPIVGRFPRSEAGGSGALDRCFANPTMPERDVVREALFTYQLTDYGWPDAVLQYALPQLEQLSIDIDCLQGNRDRMVESLRAQGYRVHVPEGTFYLLRRAGRGRRRVHPAARLPAGVRAAGPAGCAAAAVAV